MATNNPGPSSSSSSSSPSSSNSHSNSRVFKSWLLTLPADLEQKFFQDAGVQRSFALFDAFASTQALVFNWQLLRKFAHPLKMREQAMLPHEQALTAIFFCLAVFQLVFMSARPGSYILYRQKLACVNRMLRLLVVLLSAVLFTPALAKRQAEGVIALALGNDTHALMNSTLQHFSEAATSHDATSGCPAQGPCAGSTATGSAAFWHSRSTLALVKSLLAFPIVCLGHVNFVCSFRSTLFLQIVTAAATISMGLQKLCFYAAYVEATAAAVTPACRSLSAFMHTVSQLLDVQSPGPASSLINASDALCDHPLTALLLLTVWAHLVLLVLVPCTLIYSLEWSLKSKWLLQQANSAASRTSLQQQVQTGHGRGPQVRQRPPALGQVLSAIEPQPVASLIIPVWGCSWWTVVVFVGLMLCGLLLCWGACELGVAVLLRGGHRLVCDVEGWLQLK